MGANLIVFLAMLAPAAVIPDIDTPAHRAVAEQPLVELFSYEDYPADALERGAEGRVRVRVLINPRGGPQACEVLDSANDASLDAATCALLLERARFRPARDARGRAVPDLVETTVRWELEDRRAPFVQFRFRVTFRKGVDGPICIADQNGETSERQVENCLAVFGPMASALSRPGIAELQFEMRVVPTGETPVGDPLGRFGQLLWRYAGEFTVAPNGAVSRCAVTRNEAGDDIPPEAQPGPQACGTWSQSRFEEQGQGRDLRQATFEGVYVAIPGGET
jgi:protein TonB